MPDLFMVFDVESVGLHGEGFAVAWVVVDREGKELEARGYAAPIQWSRGGEAGRKWVADNVQAEESCYGVDAPVLVRDAFWQSWLRWKGRGAVLAADCPWPVEARFLAECVDDRPDQREWEGPYPLIDVASVRLAAGLDPLAKEERRPNELPEHDPLADARQSARLLLEALGKLCGRLS